MSTKAKGIPRQKLAEGQLINEIYELEKIKKWHLIVFFILSLGFFFFINFPMEESLKSLINNQLAKIPGKPIGHSALNIDFFPFPKINFKGLSFSPQMTSTPDGASLSDVALTFRRPSFYPPGGKFQFTIKEGTSDIALVAYASPLFSVLDIEKAVLTPDLYGQFLGEKLAIKGTLHMSGLLNWNDNKIDEGFLELTSKDFAFPAQRIMIVDIPTIKLGQLVFQGKFNKTGALLIDKFQIGSSHSPLEIKGRGSIQFNLKQIGSSRLTINLQLRFSDSFIQSFPLIKMALGNATPTNGFYDIKVLGTLAAPSPSPL